MMGRVCDGNKRLCFIFIFWTSVDKSNCKNIKQKVQNDDDDDER